MRDLIRAVIKAAKSYVRNWEFRQLHHSHCVRDIAKQIEWRLAMNHSAFGVDATAAYRLSKQLNELLK